MALADEEEAAEKDLESLWLAEYRHQLFTWAAEEVRPKINPRIWDAFYRTTILEEGADEVGGDLGMSRSAVYVAKCRCIAKLREKILSASGDRWESLASPSQE